MRMIFMRYPEGRAKAVTFSYDDGVAADKRLAQIFDKYGMKATFNHTGWSSDNYTSEQVEEYFLSKGHEIAVHGANHRATGYLRPIEGIKEVLECRLELEKRCGRIIRGMAYPDSGITRFGAHGGYERIRHYLEELGIVYARTLAGDNNLFQLPQDFYAWMPTAHHNNPQIMEYIDEFLGLDLSDKAYYATRAPRLFYIWGHSYEFDRDDNWEHIESICRKFAEADDVWYATNMEIYEYVQAYKALVYSADGYTVYNPSLHTVWIDADGRVYALKSGETVKLA